LILFFDDELAPPATCAGDPIGPRPLVTTGGGDSIGPLPANWEGIHEILQIVQQQTIVSYYH
jgi:hypothetical protein